MSSSFVRAAASLASTSAPTGASNWIIDDNDYQCPFRFTGKLTKLTVELEPIKATLKEILEFKWKTRD